MFHRRFAYRIYCGSLLLLLAATGCHGLILESHQPAPAKDPPAGSQQKGTAAAQAADSAATTPGPATATDRAVLAHSEWIQTVPPRDGETATPYHWRHPALDDLLERPAARRVDLRPLLADKDPIVAGNAAIGLARFGDASGAQRLAATARIPTLRLSMRCAAVEALGFLQGAEALALLRELTDQYGPPRPGAHAAYMPELHAELVRGLARHVEASAEPRLTAALRSPAGAVRLEALHAWGSGRAGALPTTVADLRSDGDARVRAAALQAMVARHHPQASPFLTDALHDTDLQVRLAAIAGLGVVGDRSAQATLKTLSKDRIDRIRAEAVTALAHAGAKQAVLEAAGDESWRVRLVVAQALAAWPDRDGAAAALRFLDDASAEVQNKTVAAVASWPLEQAGPVLLQAMGKATYMTRKTAGEQLAARWPAAAEFAVDLPPPRRKDVLEKLQRDFRQQFNPVDRQALRRALAGAPAAGRVTAEQLARVGQLLERQDVRGLKDFGPALPAALEQLAVDRHQLLPEMVYRDVLPHYEPIFATLVRLGAEDLAERRRAAEELIALAQQRPLRPLAMARLSQQAVAETDPLVWQSLLAAVAADPSDAAARMACAAVSHPADEVRRRGCEYLEAHPNAAYVSVLLPALKDQCQAVVLAAARALAAAGRLDDPQPLRQLLRAGDEQIQMEAAIALARLGDSAGVPAVERMTYSDDIRVRARAAQAMGELGNATFTAALIRLLDDHRETVSHAALASLPKVAGCDVAQGADGPPRGTSEQIRRWKQWYEEGQHASAEPQRR